MTSRRRVEHAVPNCAEAAAELSSSTARDLDKLDQAQEMGTRYMAFRNALGPFDRRERRSRARTAHRDKAK
jgi:hypothetical protein